MALCRNRWQCVLLGDTEYGVSGWPCAQIGGSVYC